MTESTRPLPSLTPLEHGGWEANSVLSSEEFTIRALGLLPPNIIVPIIVVPGVMGSNLRAKVRPRLGRTPDERNKMAAPGEAVWRPPNGKKEGVLVSSRWADRNPSQRQSLLDAATLEVDDGGPVVLPRSTDGYVLREDEVRRRGWGEVHADSYGGLLHTLQTRLNQTFGYDEQKQRRFINQHWRDVMGCQPQQWGLREFEPLTEAHLEKHARHYFPVYAFGYVWLNSSSTSAQLLEQRILEIIESWRKAKRRCDKVIVVTHSMGGLVTRACAQRIPDKIAGVIHGVMPALGAPAAYRRIACGAESTSPSNGPIENVTASRTAMVLGDTTEKTTPVLAVSPGALELLPNHNYPGPWMHVRVMQAFGPAFTPSYEVKGESIRPRESSYDYLHLPSGEVSNPYDFYRDFSSWYRLINPALVDPGGKYGKTKQGGVEGAVRSAIDQAEQFHLAIGDYYHPRTYAFYGDDNEKLSFGKVRWKATLPVGSGIALTASNVTAAEYLGHTHEGQRYVLVDGKVELHFRPEEQDTRGDGTVPHQSGAGPEGKARQVFATRGYDHQGSYKNDDMLMLTLRLIVKIVQDELT